MHIIDLYQTHIATDCIFIMIYKNGFCNLNVSKIHLTVLSMLCQICHNVHTIVHFINKDPVIKPGVQNVS